MCILYKNESGPSVYCKPNLQSVADALDLTLELVEQTAFPS